MKLLAWDTSSKAGALAALEWDPRAKRGVEGLRVLGDWVLDVDTTHSERLLWGLHQLTESVHWKMKDVDLFAVGMGPGSFTGLRIGVTTARTLAHTFKRPLIGVSSLAALARPVSSWLAAMPGGAVWGRTVVVAATDACKGELFAFWGSARSIQDCVSMADGDVPGLWKVGVEEQVLSPDALMTQIKKKLGQGQRDARWIALGEGRNRHLDSWKRLPASRELLLPPFFPTQVQGRYVGVLAWEAYQAGLAREALTVHPRYLRASDAELKLKAGLLPVAPV